MKRRTLLWGVGLGGSLALGGSLWRAAAAAGRTRDGGPYGELLPADAQGIRLPEGFTSRLVAQSTVEVPGTGYVWHGAPDGGACFAAGDGGWAYVSNAELEGRRGGAGALRFAADGSMVDAYPVLTGTERNCAGGAMPWGTWLSCEEYENGYVHETDPFGVRAAVCHRPMGRFRHEAAAADPERGVVYLTEDEPDGCFYRYRPQTWGDLSTGVLEVLAGTDAAPAWERVPDPEAVQGPTRGQVAEARRFDGGEGCYYREGVCFFTTKGDDRVWAYDAAANELSVFYDGSGALSGVDNVTGTPAGDLYVAEDGGNMEICVVDANGEASPFLRVEGQDASELTGVAFNPAGDRLYFSSQRGPGGVSQDGRTYEVRGPFRTA